MNDSQIITAANAIVANILKAAGCSDAEINAEPRVFTRNGTVEIILSAEAAFCELYADYYGTFDDEEFIHPDLEEWAAENGIFLEWENPGSILFYKETKA